MIDVLVPVLNRPHRVEPFVRSLEAMSAEVAKIVFICSLTDISTTRAIEKVGHDEDAILTMWQPGQADYAKKMNAGYADTDAEFVFLGADDISFTRGWDVEALRVAEETGAGVIATNDLNNPQVKKGLFGTHCLVRRSYVEELGGSLEGPGHLLSEAYDHNFVDRELCHLADQRGLYAFAENSHVPHLWRQDGMDATYEKGIKHFREDQRLFLRRIRGLPT